MSDLITSLLSHADSGTEAFTAGVLFGLPVLAVVAAAACGWRRWRSRR